MKVKKELLTNYYFFNSNSGNVAKGNSKSMQFFFLKIVKIEPTNKVQSFFSERDPFSAHKTSLFISYTSLIGME
jgi:hypothetical protein